MSKNKRARRLGTVDRTVHRTKDPCGPDAAVHLYCHAQDLPKSPYPVTIQPKLDRALSATPTCSHSPAGLAGEKGNAP
jgi:hypothetical protein